MHGWNLAPSARALLTATSASLSGSVLTIFGLPVGAQADECYGDETESREDAVLTGSEQPDRSRTLSSPDFYRVNAITRPLVTASLQCHGSDHAD